MKYADNEYSKVRIDFDISMKNYENTIVFDDKICDLLEEINQTGSISKAIEKLGISYRKAWGDLKSCEENLGISILEKQRGGDKGGKTILTNKGLDLLESYRRLQNRFNLAVQDCIIDFKRTIKGKNL